MKIASRSQIPPFYAMQALSDAHVLAAKGQRILHLSLGQPSARPPQRALDAAMQMLARDHLGYTESAGLQQLRERISLHYEQQYGLKVDARRIVITVGSSAAYMLSLLCAFDVGDAVALVAPHYPASPNMMLALGLRPIIMQSGQAENYQPTLAQLMALPEIPAGLVIASPSNPAGTIIDAAELAAITAWCEAKGVRIISDEIYHGVVYDGAVTQSILRYSERMIVTNSFSKYYLLPGWRLGWCVLPEELLEPAQAVLQNFFISPPTLSQYAALAVMDCRDELDAVVQDYRKNRELLLGALPAMGFGAMAPAQGAFYLYTSIAHLGLDSRAFCREMLEQTGVCAVSGFDFDKENGLQTVRFSYAGAHEVVEQACEHMQAFMRRFA